METEKCFQSSVFPTKHIYHRANSIRVTSVRDHLRLKMLHNSSEERIAQNGDICPYVPICNLHDQTTCEEGKWHTYNLRYETLLLSICLKTSRKDLIADFRCPIRHNCDLNGG